MPSNEEALVEQIEQAVVRLLATSPAGHNLYLIGGFRYRFLDGSARLSRDVDYHWEGDLDLKQAELVDLFNRRLVPEIRRKLGYEGDARSGTGPEAQSPAVRIVELAFWRMGSPGRIEVPVEITRIICLDPPAVRTADGVVYPTASDADLIESKVIALLNRRVIEHRDLCDIFLFANHLAPNAADRLQLKLKQLAIAPHVVADRLRHLDEHRPYHAGEIQAVMAAQLDPTAAAHIQAAGGATLVLDSVLAILRTKLKLAGEAP